MSFFYALEQGNSRNTFMTADFQRAQLCPRVKVPMVPFSFANGIIKMIFVTFLLWSPACFSFTPWATTIGHRSRFGDRGSFLHSPLLAQETEGNGSNLFCLYV